MIVPLDAGDTVVTILYFAGTKVAVYCLEQVKKTSIVVLSWISPLESIHPVKLYPNFGKAVSVIV